MSDKRAGNDEVVVMTRRLAGGDEQAWRWLHEHYYQLLRAAAIARGTPAADAPDLIQRTYLRVLRHARRFSSESDLRAWLCCLLRCEAIDAARSGVRRSLLAEKLQHREERRSAPATCEALEEVLVDLDPGERALVTRHYVLGWSQGELATEAGTTVKAIESRLARLRKRLRHSLRNAF